MMINITLPLSADGDFSWSSLTVTAKGQVTLKRDLLQHLASSPVNGLTSKNCRAGSCACGRCGRLERLMVSWIASTGKVKRKKPLSIEDINRIAAAGWADNLDQT